MLLEIKKVADGELEAILTTLEKSMKADVKKQMHEVWSAHSGTDLKLLFVRSIEKVPKRPDAMHYQYSWNLLLKSLGERRANQLWPNRKLTQKQPLQGSELASSKEGLCVSWCRPVGCQPGKSVPAQGEPAENRPVESQPIENQPPGIQPVENQTDGKPLSATLTTHCARKAWSCQVVSGNADDTIQASPTELQHFLEQQPGAGSAGSNRLSTQDIYDHEASLEFPPVVTEEGSDSGSMPSLEYAPPPAKKPKVETCEYFAGLGALSSTACWRDEEGQCQWCRKTS